jgi:hypothetical protein
MVYIMLCKREDTILKNYEAEIIDYVKKNLKERRIRYKLIINDLHIIESKISMIKQDDFILWHPEVAGNNLSIVKQYKYSIVLLKQKTLLIQKLSSLNPINENLAVTNGFYIMYMNNDVNDITNKEWKLVVKEETYLITIDKLLDLILKNPNNKIKRKLVIDKKVEKIDFRKEQINLSVK